VIWKKLSVVLKSRNDHIKGRRIWRDSLPQQINYNHKVREGQRGNFDLIWLLINRQDKIVYLYLQQVEPWDTNWSV